MNHASTFVSAFESPFQAPSGGALGLAPFRYGQRASSFADQGERRRQHVLIDAIQIAHPVATPGRDEHRESYRPTHHNASKERTNNRMRKDHR